MKILSHLLLGLIALLALGLIFIKLQYGGGNLYPDVITAPVIPAAQVETLVSLDFPPGNVTAAQDGRFSLPTVRLRKCIA